MAKSSRDIIRLLTADGWYEVGQTGSHKHFKESIAALAGTKMADVSLTYAKHHLEELIERVVKGEDIRISDERLGTVRLTSGAPDLLAPRVTDTMEPFVPLAEDRAPGRFQRRLGRLEGKMTAPARLFEPITQEELADWYGNEE